MNWKILIASLFCCFSGFAANISYEALGPTYFTSNRVGSVNGIVTGMIGTNAADGSLTNRNGTRGVVSIGGTNASIMVNGLLGDFWGKYETNGTPVVWHRMDGSMFIGKHADLVTTLTSYGNVQFPFLVTMTSSNEPSSVGFTYRATDSAGQNRYVMISGSNGLSTGNSQLKVEALGPAGLSTWTMTANTNFASSGLLLGDSGFPFRFWVGGNGDLLFIKSLGYSWPTARGGAGSVLTDIPNDGTLTWSPGLLSTAGTNEIKSLATNAINQNARIGPGTNNFLAKFNVVGGTNVGNSPLFSDTTNYVALRQTAATGGTYTNSATNRIFSMETSSANTNGYLEFVAPNAFGNESGHIRIIQTGYVNQRSPLLIQDAVTIEPVTNALGGHGAGDVYPSLGTTGAGQQSMGQQNRPWLDMWASRVYAIPGLSTRPQFCTGVGGTGYGINTENTGLLFWRDTGATAGFVKEEQSGSLLLDLAGNYLAFGVGLSNTVCFLGGNDQIIAGLGLIGHVQIGTNSTVAFPTNVGFIGAPGVGTDKGGSLVQIIGGPSSGTGTNGDVAILTSEKANSTSSSINSNQKTRVRAIADSTILTTNSATTVFSFTVPTTLKAYGFEVVATTEIENGVDVASSQESFIVTAVNKAATVTAGTPKMIATNFVASGGSATIDNVWSTSVSSTRVDVQCKCVTSGILSTNSRVRVVLIGNGSAVPIITRP